ncbi:MAG: trypsin-like peptidase domain-containing protein [Chloroflexota bacterium]|nr:trypsin-like peptidase domain-containing protein [Chloroflexota bacterium]
MAAKLYDLLNSCVVRVATPAKHLGTGFFVTPSLVLTCAHVIDGVQSASIEVHWNGRTVSAQVESGDASSSDLALLKVNIPEHPCVLLHGGAEPHSRLYSFGYPVYSYTAKVPPAASTTFESEGWSGDRQDLLKFKLGNARPGMSGSPVLNEETGCVCGVIQETFDRGGLLGGQAIPTPVVYRAFPTLEVQQKQFHNHNHAWSSLLTQEQRKSLPPDWQPQRAGAINVFYSYAPEDEVLRGELAKQLKLMKRQGLIDEFYAGNISAGSVEREEASKHLDAADIILLLVSPDFIYSDYHYEQEMERAMERQRTGKARVIPVLLIPIDWENTPFGGLLPLPRNRKPISTWSDRDQALYEVAAEIRRVVNELRTERGISPMS